MLVFGLPGRGKTHLCAAIGHELVRRGHAVLFTPTYQLVQRLLRAKRDLLLERELAKLDRFDAIILDDIGYVQQDRDEMEVLFTFLAERYERRSVLITSSLVFNSFTIENVPPGRYAVLAAFENDQLVRDPDEGIAGTDIVFIDVQGSTLDIAEAFKVTEALASSRPGPMGSKRSTPCRSSSGRKTRRRTAICASTTRSAPWSTRSDVYALWSSSWLVHVHAYVCGPTS